MWQGNIVSIIASSVSWIIILALVLYVYFKQHEKASLWKILIVFLIAMVTIFIPISYFEQTLNIAIIPIGLISLYFILKRRKSWYKYRPYAFIGLGVNYLFLLLALIATPLHHWIYPQHELHTYINDISQAHIIVSHPSGNSDAHMNANFIQILRSSNKDTIYSDNWYYDIVMQDETSKREKFPYMLVNVRARWGSGYTPTIFIEKDGKGILITTQHQQFYFKTTQSLLNEVASND